jgi:hypothetical protein
MMAVGVVVMGVGEFDMSVLVPVSPPNGFFVGM